MTNTYPLHVISIVVEMREKSNKILPTIPFEYLHKLNGLVRNKHVSFIFISYFYFIYFLLSIY